MRLLAALLATALAAPAPPAPPEAAAWEPALRAAEKDLCGKQVALLGENGFHGEGKTVAFKAELMRRLVTRCGYRGVFFEASHYDFLAVQRAARRREPVTEAMVASAIGGLWNKDEELAPLVPFLASAARSGRIVLGGLDDQLGSVGAFYSLGPMAAELMAPLPAARSADCTERLRQRLLWTYSEASPHDPPAFAALARCTAEARAALAADRRLDGTTRQERLQMLMNVERALGREFLDTLPRIEGRDHSMYLDFQWLAERLPAGARIIVWAANDHIAKDAVLSGNYAPAANLGGYIHRDYGRKAFALGFSAAGGRFRWGARNWKPIPAAAPNSVEGLLTAAPGEAAYAGPERLRRFGMATGALFDPRKAIPGRWSDMFDGVVVFRAERPPRRTDERP